MTLAGDNPKAEVNTLYAVPEKVEPEIGSPITTLLFELSKDLEVPAYVYIRATDTHHGANSYSLINAARYTAVLTERALDSIKYIVAYIDRQSSVAVVKEGKIIYEVGCVQENPAGDIDEKFLLEIAKEIGGAYVHASCDVDTIILSGPMLGDKTVRSTIRRFVGRLAPVTILDKNTELAVVSSHVQALGKENIKTLHLNLKEK
jgi:butyrate kinase